MKLINIYKQLLKESELNQKFDYIGDFNEFGLAKVRLNNQWNLINQEGKLISDIWFDFVSPFNEFGLLYVRTNNEYNLLNKEGKLIFNKWFDYSLLFEKIKSVTNNGLMIKYDNNNYKVIKI